jgi:hypothetical protein
MRRQGSCGSLIFPIRVKTINELAQTTINLDKRASEIIGPECQTAYLNLHPTLVTALTRPPEPTISRTLAGEMPIQIIFLPSFS